MESLWNEYDFSKKKRKNTRKMSNLIKIRMVSERIYVEKKKDCNPSVLFYYFINYGVAAVQLTVGSPFVSITTLTIPVFFWP